MSPRNPLVDLLRADVIADLRYGGEITADEAHRERIEWNKRLRQVERRLTRIDQELRDICGSF